VKDCRGQSNKGRSKKRKLLWIVVAALALTPPCVVLCKQLNEPRYDGRRLSAWVQRLTYYDRELFSGAPDPFETLSQAGADAVPLLIAMLRAHDSELKLRFLGVARRLPFVKIRHTCASDRYYAAMTVFDRRQATSRAAIPNLIQMLTESDADYRGLPQWAGNHLAALGDDAVSPLIHSLESGNPATREAVAKALGGFECGNTKHTPFDARDHGFGYHTPTEVMPGNKEKIMQALRRASLDPNATVRVAATNALKNLERNDVARPTG